MSVLTAVKTLVVTAVAATTLAAPVVAHAAPAQPAAPVAVIADEGTLAHHLQYMREEERLARDLYRALSNHYGGLRPFSNIVRAEQRHFNAMGWLLDNHKVADPSVGLPAGTYAFDELSDLYSTLYTRGIQSRQEAFKVGIVVEETDIADIDAALAEIEAPDVRRVLGNLRWGSTRHLRAFTRASGGGWGHGGGWR